MSFFRYYKERKDADGENIWWPGGPDGYPFRGQQPPLMNDKEYEQLKLAGKFRCRTFYLDESEDLKEYTAIRDKCANGLWVPVDRDRQWDAVRNNYRVYLEWLELAYEAPPVLNGVNRDAVRNLQSQATPTIMPFSRLAGVNKDW